MNESSCCSTSSPALDVLNALTFSSLQFSRSMVSDSLQPHGLQDAELPCPSPSPGVCSNSCPLSQWCHPTISSSVAPFSSCLQSFAASVFSNDSALRITWPEHWSFSFSISLSSEYSGLISFRIDWFDLLAVQGLTRVLSITTVWKHQFFSVQPSLWSNSYICTWILKTNIALSIRTFVGKVISLLFNILSRFVIAFLQRNKPLLISWLQSPSTVLWEPEKIKSVIVSMFFPHLFAMKLWDWMPWS